MMTSAANSLAQTLGHRLRSASLKMTAAESCTGGGFSEAITSVPGSSAWFDAAFVTYSNAMKSALLSVPENMIAEHGAVSVVVAEAMLRGAISLSGADLGVAITGIAGPGGGTVTKPVGTVCIAFGGVNDEVVSETHVFRGDRQAVRSQSVIAALQHLLTYV